MLDQTDIAQQQIDSEEVESVDYAILEVHRDTLAQRVLEGESLDWFGESVSLKDILEYDMGRLLADNAEYIKLVMLDNDQAALGAITQKLIHEEINTQIKAKFTQCECMPSGYEYLVKDESDDLPDAA